MRIEDWGASNHITVKALKPRAGERWVSGIDGMLGKRGIIAVDQT